MEESKEVAKTGVGSELPEHFKQESFVKKLADTDIFVLKCPGCGKIHFRHAGYINVLFPHVTAKEGNKIAEDDKRVMLCVGCKMAIIFYDGKVIDVTEHIDLNAWSKTEEEAHKATGPGGQC